MTILGHTPPFDDKVERAKKRTLPEYNKAEPNADLATMVWDKKSGRWLQGADSLWLYLCDRENRSLWAMFNGDPSTLEKVV